MSKCCWGHEDCPIPRTEKAVKEFTHTHDGETCAPHCYGCFIQNEALADAMALRAEVERLKECAEFWRRDSVKHGDLLADANLQVGVLREALTKIRHYEFDGDSMSPSGIMADDALKGGVEKPFQRPQTLLPDGSAPPGVTWPSFSGDTNTGRYRDASGEIQFVKDGVAQKRKEGS